MCFVYFQLCCFVCFLFELLFIFSETNGLSDGKIDHITL